MASKFFLDTCKCNILMWVSSFYVDCRCPGRHCSFFHSCPHRGRCLNLSFYYSAPFSFSFQASVSGFSTYLTCFMSLVYLMLLPVSCLVFMLQVVKQRMQTGQFTSAPNAVRMIVSKEGFKGLYAVWYLLWIDWSCLFSFWDKSPFLPPALMHLLYFWEELMFYYHKTGTLVDAITLSSYCYQLSMSFETNHLSLL